jgi:hypothetical protein
MAQLTWQIQDTPGCHKPAAQDAKVNCKQCKLADHHNHTLVRLRNLQITYQNLLSATENTETQGTKFGKLITDSSEGVFPSSCVRYTLINITDQRQSNNAKNIYQYLEIHTHGSQNCPIGLRSCSTLFDNKILHVAITVRLRGKNETSNFQSQSDGVYYRPTIHERRHPVNNGITTGEMAEEGTPSKKPRHEDIAQTNAQVSGIEANSQELVLSNINLPQEESSPLHGAKSPSHGKKRSASALTTPEKLLIPETGIPSPQEEIDEDESPPVDQSDDEYIPPMEPDVNTPLPPACPAVPSERSIRWLTSAQEQGAAFKLGGADLSSALNLIPGMQILFAADVTARESVPAQCQTIFPFAQGADSFVGYFNAASAIPSRELRMGRINIVINDIERAIAQVDAAIVAINSLLGLLKSLQEAILNLGTHQDAFQQVVEKQGGCPGSGNSHVPSSSPAEKYQRTLQS